MDPRLFSDAFQNTVLRLRFAWPLVPAGILLAPVYLALHLTLRGNFVSQFILAVLQIFLLAWIYTALETINDYAKEARPTLEKLLKGYWRLDTRFFLAIVNTGFVLFPLSLVHDLLIGHPETYTQGAVIGMLTLFVLNPISEKIIVDKAEGLAAVSTSFTFMQKNWLPWVLLSLLSIAPLLLYPSKEVLLLLSGTSPFFPAQPVLLAWSFFGAPLSLIFGVAASVFFLVFRIELYKKL